MRNLILAADLTDEDYLALSMQMSKKFLDDDQLFALARFIPETDEQKRNLLNDKNKFFLDGEMYVVLKHIGYDRMFMYVEIGKGMFLQKNELGTLLDGKELYIDAHQMKGFLCKK